MRLNANSNLPPRQGVAAALRACNGAFLGVALFSGVINILMLTGPFFMLQVYDRVLASRSIPTLTVLLGLVALLFAFQAVLDILRGRILTRIGDRFDARARPAVFDMVARPAGRRRGNDGLQPIRDLDLIRQFLGSPGPAAFFDLPWVPAYLAIVFLFHPWLGIVATVGAVLLCVFASLIEITTRRSSRDAVRKTSERNAVAETCRLHGDYLGVMGMLPIFRARWNETHAAMLERSRSSGDVSGTLGAFSRVSRLLLQSLILAVGAYLVIQEELTGGVMIAASIIASRALAPIEQAVGHWRMFLGTRQAYRRLAEASEAMPDVALPHALPAPRRRLDVANLAVTPPGGERPTLAGASFSLEAGQALAVIGPSGSGKSSLAHGIVGIWTTNRGAVRLDGATPDQWDQAALGRHIGYLAQDVELFEGTVAENIARFSSQPDEAAVLTAARRAGVHELIVKLPKGYDTLVGAGGIALSGGQRQRIALARALYGEPFLIVLDEPNSNLDAEGETALARAIKQSREAGSVVIVIAHRPSVLAAVDQVLVVADGRQKTVGPKDEVLGRALQQPVIAGDKVA